MSSNLASERSQLEEIQTRQRISLQKIQAEQRIAFEKAEKEHVEKLAKMQHGLSSI